MGGSCSGYLEGVRRRKIRATIEDLTHAKEIQMARAKLLESDSNAIEGKKTALKQKYRIQKTTNGRQIVTLWLRQAIKQQASLRKDIQQCLDRVLVLERLHNSIEEQLRTNEIAKAMRRCVDAQKALQKEVNEDTVDELMSDLEDANDAADGASQRLMSGAEGHDADETAALELELQGLIDDAVRELVLPDVPMGLEAPPVHRPEAIPQSL